MLTRSDRCERRGQGKCSGARQNGAHWSRAISAVGRHRRCSVRGKGRPSIKKHYRQYKEAAPRLGQFLEVVPSVPTPKGWEVELEFPNGLHLRVRG